MMLVLIVYTFTLSIYVAATAMPESLHNAAIAIVDEDGSPLSARIASAFYPPQFMARLVTARQADAGLDAGDYTFVLDIPPNFQRDVLAGRAPAVQLNVDATRMSQAFTGNGYIQQIVSDEVTSSCSVPRPPAAPVELACACASTPTWSSPGSAR
jgi:ABC-2 type transport system permease protein